MSQPNAPQDDLTAERAAIYTYHKVFDGYNFLSGQKGMEEIVGHDMELVSLDDHLAALKTARQEALREAARQARFGAMELRAMNEPLGTDQRGYGQKALQDFADILDRLASEGG